MSPRRSILKGSGQQRSCDRGRGRFAPALAMHSALRKFPDGGKIYFSVISEVPVQSDSAEVRQDSTAEA